VNCQFESGFFSCTVTTFPLAVMEVTLPKKSAILEPVALLRWTFIENATSFAVKVDPSENLMPCFTV
jgi:hypothetical protein